WSMKEQALDNGNVDCLWNGYSITEERKARVAFSKPYFDNKQIAITMSTESPTKLADLKDQVVGTQAASSALEAIEANKEFIGMIKDKKPVTYDTYDKALRDLEIGRIKAVVGDEVLLKYYITQRGADKYKVLEGDLGSEQYGVGFRKNDTELRDKIDKALDDMKADGTFDNIKKKWFNQ
ncbi:transporter substrate-binding domain-containing protein, partial [Peptostreptococcus sp.]